MNNQSTQQILTIVVPVYNEEDVFEEFYHRLSSVLQSIPMRAEIIVVNDGSRDGTLTILERLYEQDNRLAIVDLSRNFGKEIALTAGLPWCWQKNIGRSRNRTRTSDGVVGTPDHDRGHRYSPSRGCPPSFGL